MSSLLISYYAYIDALYIKYTNVQGLAFSNMNERGQGAPQVQDCVIRISSIGASRSHEPRACAQATACVRHESAILLVAVSAIRKVLTQHISYPALGRL